MRFAIFTHVQHTERDGQYYAYAPYIREMNLWLKQVEEVEVVAPAPLPPKGETLNKDAYRQMPLWFTRIPSFDLLNFRNAVKAFFEIPVIIFKIGGAMQRADHLHLRCPGNIGLLACICQVFFPKKPKTAKYAGNWDPQAKQPRTYKLQKWILSNTFMTKNMQVLVYGEWPGQSGNIKPFFTASFSEKQISKIKKKSFEGAITFLFVGNLVEGKRPMQAVKLVEALQKRSGGNPVAPVIHMEVYGDGPERKRLEKYVAEHELEERVIFKGSRPLAELKEAYQKAHFVILPSKSEGWPKAIAEAMFFGCIPIATPVSCVPWMLGGAPPAPEGGAKALSIAQRGILIPVSEKRENKEQVERIIKLLKDQETMQRMSESAKEWSQQYTVEKFEVAIRRVLNNSGEQRIIETGKLSPGSPACRQEGFREGVKRGKSKE